MAPYDYVFVWDEDLGIDNFTAEPYVSLQLYMLFFPSSQYMWWMMMNRQVVDAWF